MTVPESPSTEPLAVTMSFLLTDIEDSTVHWERAGGVFREALDLHHCLLRQEIERHGGQELTEAGDGFLVAFEESRAAAECAIALQRALEAAAWPEEVGTPRDSGTARQRRVSRGDLEPCGPIA